MEWNLHSAQEAFSLNRLQDWIEEYLQVAEWEDLGLLKRVQSYSTKWLEPSLLPIATLERIAGPGDLYRFPQDPGKWAEEVSRICDGAPAPDDLPPVIAWREVDGVLNLADGNHRVDALTALGYQKIWVILHDGPLRSEEEIVKRKLMLSSASCANNGEKVFNMLADQFVSFAQECAGSSELYHLLSLKIAQDEDILAIADSSRVGQPQPNMLFAAVHYLLMNGKANPLSRYYPSLTLEPESPEFAFPAFRKFVLMHSGEISTILEERLVQTNEAQRSAYLFPAIHTIHRLFSDKKASLIEVGSSAGFNLLWDQYAYQYDEEEPVGLTGSSLTISSSFRGDKRPDLSGSFPLVSNRIGIDLNPIDLMDRDQVLWLQALVWPEHFERKARLNKAIRVAMVNPINVVQGDATEVLPAILADVPSSDVAYVYHTHVANQMTPEQRAKLLQIIDDFGQKQDIVHIHNNIEPHLHATIYRNGERMDRPLAKVDGHARWIEWLDSD